MRRRKRDIARTLPEKANRILNGVLVVLVLILFRLWHVGVLQHEEKLEASRRPQRRTVIERAERATICDRFGIPLALNKVQHNAGISYGAIREIPRCVWKRDARGKRVKILRRKEHIAALASLLGAELQMDPERIEDLIHSKASIFGSVPFVLKENIDEKTFFRLKMLEKDWPGITAETVARRIYPHGALGGEIIGYMGMISPSEYETITTEMRILRDALASHNPLLPEGYTTCEEVEGRLKELEAKAYTINDYVGKAGVEGVFDERLRGSRGKRVYQADIHGNLLKELTGSEDSQPGECVQLTISAELQRYAEQLLIEYEQNLPSGRPSAAARRALLPEKQPWMKGGAIVVMDPRNGEVLALASYPRFDPADFIRGNGEKIGRWLESDAYLAAVWNMKLPLERERFDPLGGTFFDEGVPLTWEVYLGLVLPERSPVRQVLGRFGTVGDALFLQDNMNQLLDLYSSETLTAGKVVDFLYQEDDVPQGTILSIEEREFLMRRNLEVHAETEKFKERLKPYFDSLPLNYEKLLLADLMRLIVAGDRFTPELAVSFGELPLSEYRAAAAHFVSVREAVRSLVADLFHDLDFRRWRDGEFKKYLAQKRKEEAAAKKKYGRPYIEYLDEMEKRLFETFWEEHQWECLACFLTGREVVGPYLQALATWRSELVAGAHTGLPWAGPFAELKKIADETPSQQLIPLLKTLRGFEELQRPLLGRYGGVRRSENGQLEKHLASAFYPLYGCGYARSQAFRQAATLGSIFKIIPAYEAMRQRYVAMRERGEIGGDLNPLKMRDDKHRTYGKGASWNVGYTLDGKPIPIFYRGGRLPRSEHAGVGVVDVVRALETSSNPYFALLAGDVLEDPEDLISASSLFGLGEKTGIDLPGEISGQLPTDVAYNRTGLYALAIGQHTLVATPLQTAVMLASFANGGKILKPKIACDGNEASLRWEVLMPPEIADPILQGMKHVVTGEKGTARTLRSLFPQNIYNQLIGKTSTAEAVERLSLDGSSGLLKSKHVWFGAVAYDTPDLRHPELVVVVYLRHGGWGWEAAPLAAKIIQKFRDIDPTK